MDFFIGFGVGFGSSGSIGLDDVGVSVGTGNSIHTFNYHEPPSLDIHEVPSLENYGNNVLDIHEIQGLDNAKTEQAVFFIGDKQEFQIDRNPAFESIAEPTVEVALAPAGFKQLVPKIGLDISTNNDYSVDNRHHNQKNISLYHKDVHENHYHITNLPQNNCPDGQRQCFEYNHADKIVGNYCKDGKCNE